MRECRRCKIEKSLDQFYTRNDGKYLRYICKACTNKVKYASRKANGKDNGESKGSRMDRHERLKREVFQAYGNKCVCCGEKELHFLTIDHINGLPDRHRQLDGRRVSGTRLLYLLRQEGYPKDCRILCWNCNCSYAYYGFCPHQPHDISERRYQ